MWSTSGQYTSYWNAFLLINFFSLCHSFTWSTQLCYVILGNLFYSLYLIIIPSGWPYSFMEINLRITDSFRVRYRIFLLTKTLDSFRKWPLLWWLSYIYSSCNVATTNIANRYRPQSKSAKGNVFTGICLFMGIWGGGGRWHRLYQWIGHMVGYPFLLDKGPGHPTPPPTGGLDAPLSHMGPGYPTP